jgi:hypothetical protein
MAMAQPHTVIKVGYEQFVPPPVPPGMRFGRDTWLILPLGARPAGQGRVAADGPAHLAGEPRPELGG